MKSEMCDWFEVRPKGYFQVFFLKSRSVRRGEEPYFCTVTELRPKRDAELRKNTQERSGQAE